MSSIQHTSVTPWVVILISLLCTVEVAAQTCTDNTKNGLETDVDCGGGTCPACLTARGCLADRDCLSGSCVSGKCKEPAACHNGVKDRRETCVDGGGGECFAACAVGATCGATWDCRSRICTGGRCQVAASCSNSVTDGFETGLNCGGGACPPCASGQGCKAAADCLSGNCGSAGVCAAPPAPAWMADGLLNKGETAVDCGGPNAPPCAGGKTCYTDSDCGTQWCIVS